MTTAQTTQETLEHQSPPTRPVPVGQKAPDFKLHTTPDQSVALSDFLGRPVVLVFYPADWSPVCGDQLTLYNQLLPEWHRRHTQILAISVDGPWCHRAFSENRGLHFPLLSDFEPKGDVAKRYGVYDFADGSCDRALFVIDKDGIVAWNYVSPAGVNPGADGILDALDAMPRGGLQ